MPKHKPHTDLNTTEDTTKIKDTKSTPSIPKEKPTISVTEKSSSDKIIQSSWLFLSSFQFFSVFKTYFNLPTLDIEELEHALLRQETSELLETVMVCTLSPLLSPNKSSSLDTDNYEKYLFDLFPDFGPSFHRLSIIEKIRLLKMIEEANLENKNEGFLNWRNKTDDSALRLSSLGKDNDGWSYWFFGGNRLYRETPISNGKRATKSLKDNHLTFELVCSTIEEWEKTLDRFQQKKRIASKDTSEKITSIAKNTISKLKSVQAAKARQEAKLKREKELELIPKKRSRRLETKFEQESKRQKLNEIADQQAIMDDITRKAQKEKAKKAKEEEELKYRIKDARLKNEISDYVKRKAYEANEFKQLKNLLHKNADKAEKIVKMRGWLKLLKDYEDVSVKVFQENKGYIVLNGDDKGKSQQPQYR